MGARFDRFILYKEGDDRKTGFTELYFWYGVKPAVRNKLN